MTEARTEVLTVRVTKAQKRRIRREAKKNGESVSALVLRAIESIEGVPKRKTWEPPPWW